MLEKKIKVLLTGGGTAGSVSPLLAMAEDLRQLKGRAIDFCWLGGYHGPERAMAGDVDIKFVAISSGKLRRYFSLFARLPISQPGGKCSRLCHNH